MSTILTTGGCGFLGWNVARGLTQVGERVVCYDIRQLNNSQKVKMPQKGALDISRAREEMGYHSQYNLEKDLRKYIGWLKDHS